MALERLKDARIPKRDLEQEQQMDKCSMLSGC